MRNCVYPVSINRKKYKNVCVCFCLSGRERSVIIHFKSKFFMFVSAVVAASIVARNWFNLNALCFLVCINERLCPVHSSVYSHQVICVFLNHGPPDLNWKHNRLDFNSREIETFKLSIWRWNFSLWAKNLSHIFSVTKNISKNVFVYSTVGETGESNNLPTIEIIMIVEWIFRNLNFSCDNFFSTLLSSKYALCRQPIFSDGKK